MLYIPFTPLEAIVAGIVIVALVLAFKPGRQDRDRQCHPMRRRIQFSLKWFMLVVGFVATIAASTSESRLTREIAFLSFLYLIALWVVGER